MVKAARVMRVVKMAKVRRVVRVAKVARVARAVKVASGQRWPGGEDGKCGKDDKGGQWVRVRVEKVGRVWQR